MSKKLLAPKSSAMLWSRKRQSSSLSFSTIMSTSTSTSESKSTRRASSSSSFSTSTSTSTTVEKVNIVNDDRRDKRGPQGRHTSERRLERLIQFLDLSSRFDELQHGKTRFSSHVLGFKPNTLSVNDFEEGHVDSVGGDDRDDSDAHGVVSSTCSPKPLSRTSSHLSSPTAANYPNLKFRYKIPKELLISTVPPHPLHHKSTGDSPRRTAAGAEADNEHDDNIHGGGGGDTSSSRGAGRVSLSMYTALLDEVTTWSVTSATLSSSATAGNVRPGVSVSLSTRWIDTDTRRDTDNHGGGGIDSGSDSSSGHGSRDIDTDLDSSSHRYPKSRRCDVVGRAPGDTIDIVTTVTKLGMTMAFLRADVIETSTGRTVCTFDHIKYLPVPWTLYVVLSPIGRMILDLYVSYVLPYWRSSSILRKSTIPKDFDRGKHGSGAEETEQSDQGLLDTFRFTSDSSATFVVKDIHTNGFGGLQGGVQAILMEHLGRHVAALHLSSFEGTDEGSYGYNCHNVECSQLQVSYQSTASKVVYLRADILSADPMSQSVTIRVSIFKTKSKKSKKASVNGDEEIDGRRNDTAIVSEGMLTFRRI